MRRSSRASLGRALLLRVTMCECKRILPCVHCVLSACLGETPRGRVWERTSSTTRSTIQWYTVITNAVKNIRLCTRAHTDPVCSRYINCGRARRPKTGFIINYKTQHNDQNVHDYTSTGLRSTRDSSVYLRRYLCTQHEHSPVVELNGLCPEGAGIGTGGLCLWHPPHAQDV